MKKLMSLFLSGIAVVALSGCGSSSAGVNNGGNPPEIISAVDILDLDLGYRISGINSDDDSIDIEYCGANYDIYVGADYHSGTFDVNDAGDRINMFDDDGGSYRIDTPNGLLELDEDYEIKFVDDYILVESISEISC